MRSFVAALALLIGLAFGPAVKAATIIPLDSTNWLLTGGASFNGGKILFAANENSTATTTQLQNYVPASGPFVIDITGHDNNNNEFLATYTYDGTSLALNFNNSGSGFSTLPFFVQAYTSGGQLRLDVILTANGGNQEGQISQVSVSAVPGPIAGAGIPALMALGGMVFLRRRRKSEAA